MLIGLVGLIGSGKDTVAEQLVKQHNFKRDSFAKSLKDATANIFGWDRALLEGYSKESREWREQPDRFWSEKFGKEVTPRWILQYFGTEVCRENMLDSIWVDSLVARYRGENTVISDTRFVNEINTIRKQGGKIVLVKRGEIPSREEMQASGAHQSEWDWIGCKFDYEINNNGTLQELYTSVDDMLSHLLQDHQ
jgi:adenylate kinase family enzyme